MGKKICHPWGMVETSNTPGSWNYVIDLHLTMIHDYIQSGNYQTALIVIYHTAQLSSNLGFCLDHSYEVISPNLDLIVTLNDDLDQLWDDLGNIYDDIYFIAELTPLENTVGLEKKSRLEEFMHEVNLGSSYDFEDCCNTSTTAWSEVMNLIHENPNLYLRYYGYQKPCSIEDDNKPLFNPGDYFMNDFGQVIKVKSLIQTPWGDWYPEFEILTERLYNDIHLSSEGIDCVAFWILGGESDKYDEGSWNGKQRDCWRKKLSL